ncbi:MAG: hypothetical protein ABW352_12100 [Polyangiales bacterium]
MTTIAKLLKVLPAVGLLGCVSDFSPDPYKPNPYQVTPTDGGAGTDAGGRRDASTVNDARTTTPSNDSSTPPDDPDIDPPVGEPDSGGPSTDPPASACDLTGRWIMTERALSSAYGARQINLLWHYLELTQQGDVVTMKKSLLCGGSTQGEPGGFPVMMDDSQAWPAYQEKTNYNGRKGSSKESGGGCDVTFEESVLVRGATPGAFTSMSTALPMQEASGNTPGWEDWDADGKQGVTMNVSGSASGKVFTSFRTFSNYSGSVDANPATMRLSYDWVQDRIVHATDPGDPITRSLLASPAERAPDEAKNFVELARLAADQAAGNDDAICEAIRTLAPTLNANANKI